MSQIKTEISKLFNNEKVGDLFSNSDGGQGIIGPEIDRYFSFAEIKSILIIFRSDSFVLFLRNYDTYHNLQQFFDRLFKRTSEIEQIYESSKTTDYILKLIKENEADILKKYSPRLAQDCQIQFVKDYLSKHKEIKEKTYENVKDFFDNPLSWV